MYKNIGLPLLKFNLFISNFLLDIFHLKNYAVFKVVLQVLIINTAKCKCEDKTILNLEYFIIDWSIGDPKSQAVKHLIERAILPNTSTKNSNK